MNELKVFSDDLIPVYVTDTGNQVVIGRELHESLEIKTNYKDWFPRMAEYGFTEGTDFNSLKNERVQKEGNREVKRRTTDIVMLAMELNAECKKTKCNECPFSTNICTCRLAYDRPNHWQLDGLRGRRNENE